MKTLLSFAVSVSLLFAAATTAAKPRKVAVVVYERVEILDFAGPTEVLAAASSFAQASGEDALEVYLVGKTTRPIKAQGIVEVTPTYAIENAPKPDVVVIPGGASDALTNDPAMMAWLLRVTSASEATLTVCTGAFPLAKAGAFDGLEITTFYDAVDRLRGLAPKAKVTHGRRFIDNGRYITTAGVSAGIDGALHLTARMFGRRVAEQTARYMEYHWAPEPYLAKDYVYWNPSLSERGRQLQMANALIEEKRLAEGIAALERLALTDTDGSIYYSLGTARYHARDYQGAAAAYAKVGQQSASYKHALYNLACSYALAGDRLQALAAAKRALAAGVSKEQAIADSDLASIKAELAAL